MNSALGFARLLLAPSLCAGLAAGAFGQNQPEIVQAPEGGRLDAIDPEGNTIGPCPLKHTEVAVEIAGHFTRVNLRQTYQNPYDEKIEAVYTFPMSHRAAVDRMRMIVGERVVEGEVKERDEARRIYEAARAQGYVASLLEQERPNIFAQSVANIEPGREVIVEISYVEVLEATDGVYSFDFPMVVGPRYIPGSPTISPALVPAELEVRRGVLLLGPARLEVSERGTVDTLGTLQTGKLHALLTAAQPIKQPPVEWYPTLKNDAGEESRTFPDLWYAFTAGYCDGSKEIGRLFTDGTGHLNGRWFYTDPKVIAGMGTGFAQNTNQVPDASKITPEPVRPGERAGHDISISMSIDTGGPNIAQLKSISHEITFRDAASEEQRDEGADPIMQNLGSNVALALTEKSTIPNKDFVVSWSLESGDSIAEAILAYTAGGDKGSFITLILNPPTRVDEEIVRDREIIFVMDTSGSMRGYPIDKSKEVMRRIFDAMRPDDTFNLITFAGHTQILWDDSKFATQKNREEALKLVDQQRGSGGTEMMKAINAALVQKREVAASSPANRGASPEPLRIVIFLTDGYVGNDMAIIDRIEKNRGTTRVFSFGIGNSVNRYLIDGMAKAGRGEAEIVMLESDADEAVARLTKRIQTPVLTDISLEFSDGISLTDVLPGTHRGEIPDLFDAKPLVIHAKYDTPGTGTLTIRGRNAQGDYERTVALDLPAQHESNDTIATLWARAKIDDLMQGNLAQIQQGTPAVELRNEIIALGVNYQIMSQFTSFIAVEKSRVTIGGEPVLVPVPIEMPEGVSYEGIFGETGQAVKGEDGELILSLQVRPGSPPQAEFGRRDQFVDASLAKTESLGLVRRSLATPPASAPMRLARPAAMRARGTLATRRGPALTGGGRGGGGGGFAGGGGVVAGGEAADFETLWAQRQQVGQGRSEGEFIGDYIKTLEEHADELGEDQSPSQVLLRSLFGATDQKLFAERLSITIADLAETGEMNAAEIIARALIEIDGANDTSKQLGLIFDDVALDEKERAAKLTALADANRKTIRKRIAGDVRSAILRHRLADVLVPFAEGAGFPDALAEFYHGPWPANAEMHEGGAILNILLRELDDESIARLESLGIVIIERVDESSYVIAAVPLGRIDDVALLDGVRRVEITRMER